MTLLRPETSGSARLRPREHRAVRALIECVTIRGAAESVGVNERTLRRWLGREDFRESYREACREALSDALHRLQGAAGGAVQTLREIARDNTAKPAERAGAARALLDHALRSAELLNVEARLDALETGARARGRFQ